jgi:hypothetical protein
MSEVAGQNGNVLFLVCKPCQQSGAKDFGVKLAGRAQRSWYTHMVPPKQFDAWLHSHAKCGGRTKPDHFQLGYLQDQNADQSEIEAAVKLAVVK